MSCTAAKAGDCLGDRQTPLVAEMRIEALPLVDGHSAILLECNRRSVSIGLATVVIGHADLMTAGCGSIKRVLFIRACETLILARASAWSTAPASLVPRLLSRRGTCEVLLDGDRAAVPPPPRLRFGDLGVCRDGEG